MLGPKLGGACRSAAAALFVLSGAAALSSCSLPGDAVNGYYAPLGALPATDVVVETNLKSAATTGGGNTVTQGPSTGPSVISEGSSGTDTAFVGFNPLTYDCLGLLEIGAGGAASLGETAAGSYYFWAKNTSASACAASSFLALPAAPSKWVKGDPSDTGWPGA